MRCAIYARRSTEEHQVASLDVQIDEATRYVTGKGWSVAPGHVYRDDAVSRAEFKKRPGPIAMLNALDSGEFDAIVLRDDTRLGGDIHRTGLVVQDIVEAGKRLICYFEDHELKADGATDRIMTALRGFAAELEREKIAGRIREHLMTKARRGLVAGGCCYGYDNVPIVEGDRRVAVDYKINEAEAAIVREVFERRAKGEGYRTIAHALNRRGVPSPKAGRRGSGSWAHTAIREMLLRERYAGLLVWGRIDAMIRCVAAETARQDEGEGGLLRHARHNCLRWAGDQGLTGQKPDEPANATASAAATATASGFRVTGNHFSQHMSAIAAGSGERSELAAERSAVQRFSGQRLRQAAAREASSAAERPAVSGCGQR